MLSLKIGNVVSLKFKVPGEINQPRLGYASAPLPFREGQRKNLTLGISGRQGLGSQQGGNSTRLFRRS